MLIQDTFTLLYLYLSSNNNTKPALLIFNPLILIN